MLNVLFVQSSLFLSIHAVRSRLTEGCCQYPVLTITMMLKKLNIDTMFVVCLFLLSFLQ